MSVKIDTGNPFADAVKNIQRIIDDEKVSLGIVDVYDNDRTVVEVFPSVAVVFDGHTEETSSLGSPNSKIKLTMVIQVWVYVEQVSPRMRDEDFKMYLWRICEVIRKKVTLDGWCQSCQVVGSRVQVRMRLNAMLGGGRITVSIEKITRANRES